MTTCRILPVLLLFFAAAFPSLGSPTLVFSPSEWKFGSIQRGEKIQTAVTVKNTGDTDITVSFLPTCTCNTAVPAERLITAGGEGTFVITYDSSDDTGITRKDFIIRTQPPGVAPPYYTSTGIVRAERRAGTGPGRPGGVRGLRARSSVRRLDHGGLLLHAWLPYLRRVPVNRDSATLTRAWSFPHRGAKGRLAAGRL